MTMHGVTLTMLLLFLLAGGGSDSTTAGCTCHVPNEIGSWCEIHQVGHVALVEITSRSLFDALDTHGHDVDPSTFSCGACQAAIRTDGFCEEHRTGFVSQRAYFSRLTHVLAKGSPRSMAEIDCPVCRENARTLGWCDSCRIGMVGRIAIEDNESFDHVSRALAIVAVAQEAAATCEYCAVAIVTDTQCPVCRIRYRDGKPVEE